MVQTANSAFQLFQQALANSYVSIPNLTLAGVQQINSFNETSTPTYALSNDILTLVNNTEAQTLRNNANADIVITLTNGNYANTSAAYGVSSQIDADASHAFSIVEDYSAVTNYSLAHEIGHLYGGRHELNLDNTNTPVSYIHGYAFRHWTFWPFYHDYGTLMKTLENGRSRILNYSNPSVIVDSENAGALPYNNVSQRITDNVSRIAAFRGGAGPLSCSISGPYSISNSGCFPYNSDVTCGSAPYTYTWTVSSDGYNYYFSSSSASASVCVYPGSSYAASGNVYMRLQINSSDGQIAYAYFSSTVSNIHMIAPGNSGAGNNKFDGYILSEASPNPTNSISTISFSVPQKQNIRLELFNELGGSVQLLGEGEYETGEYAVSVNSDRLVSGIYFYKLTAGSFSQTKKLLVTK